MVGPSERIALSDGATMAIDVSSIATQGQAAIILGWPTIVLAAGAGGDTSWAAGRPAIGVLRDSRGVIRLVPAPLPGVEALYPRAASAGTADWHVIFVTGEEGIAEFDSADVWYGLYDGHRWRQVERVARAQSAKLGRSRSSELVVTTGGLAFAYPFDRSFVLNSNAPGNQGLILLQRQGTRWVEDTLRTWDGPRAVQLVADGDGGVRAVYAGEYFANGRPHGPVLFTARHGSSRWSAPRIVLDAAPRAAGIPLLVSPWTSGSIVSWTTTARSLTLDLEETEWGIVTSDGTVQRHGRVAAADAGDWPAVLRLDAQRTVWFIRNGNSREELHVFMTVDSTVHDLGLARVPLYNFVTRGATLPDGRMFIVTGGLGTAPSEPPASSFFTTFAVRCATR